MPSINRQPAAPPSAARRVAIVAMVGVACLAAPLRSAVGADSISFEATGLDRQAIDREAGNYCAMAGKAAAFSSQTGSRLTYDCVPVSGEEPTPAYVPPATDQPAAAPQRNGHDSPSIAYDATRYDRQAIIAAASRYCGALGKSAAFSGRSGSLVNYDCIPYSDAAAAVVAAPPPPVGPSVVFEFTGDNQQTIEAEAARQCTTQGRVAVFHGQDGTRVTYDCVVGARLPDTTVPATDGSGAPSAVPTITYSMAGNSQQNVDAPAIRYCAMLGMSPALRSESGGSRTYECR